MGARLVEQASWNCLDDNRMRPDTSETESCIDKASAIRAATESMTVVARGKGRFEVYSGETGRYDVNLVAGTCDCPAAKYQEGDCKHLIRVRQEAGLAEIPDLGARRLDVEIMMSADAEETEPTVATDGGTVVETASETETETDGRPDDCDCTPAFCDDDLGCWPCYRDGFETMNPNVEDDDEVSG